jgi:hypothetical protein
MDTQLRVYQIKPGAMDEWIREWRVHVRPLRERHGFAVLGAWLAPNDDTFVWILAHEAFEAANDAYYASSERRALDPDPARHVLATSTWMIQAVPEGLAPDDLHQHA